MPSLAEQKNSKLTDNIIYIFFSINKCKIKLFVAYKG